MGDWNKAQELVASSVIVTHRYDNLTKAGPIQTKRRLISFRSTRSRKTKGPCLETEVSLYRTTPHLPLKPPPRPRGLHRPVCRWTSSPPHLPPLRPTSALEPLPPEPLLLSGQIPCSSSVTPPGLPNLLMAGWAWLPLLNSNLHSNNSSSSDRPSRPMSGSHQCSPLRQASSHRRGTRSHPSRP